MNFSAPALSVIINYCYCFNMLPICRYSSILFRISKRFVIRLLYTLAGKNLNILKIRTLDQSKVFLCF